MLKFVFPHGGWGLGNDLIPWCKAYILKKQLGDQAALLGPAWGNNPRRYYRYFGTPRFDHLYCRAILKLVPNIPFTEEMYRDSGRGDFEGACAYFIEKHGLRKRKAYAVTVTGLWGAFPGIASARDFALRALLSTKYTADNLYSLASRANPDKLAVGVHVRRGDFFEAGSASNPLVHDGQAVTQGESWEEGVCGVRISMGWYLRVLANLESRLGNRNIQYFVCTDGTREEIGSIFSGRDAVFCSELGNSDISDLIWLSRCDALVCSISSFSGWAAFLSGAPYVWYGAKPARAEAVAALDLYKTIGLQLPELDTSGENGRGYLADNAGAVPDALLLRLAQRLREKSRRST